jgi:signal recognition particle GTPase
MTPDSSPPPSHSDSSVEKSNDPGISEAMLKEEEAIRKRMDKEEKAHDAKMAKERSNLVKQGSGAVDKKFKALEYLLNQSKVRWKVSFVSTYYG